MNNQRRKAIAKINAELSALRDRLDEIMNDEQEAFDNMPDSLREGERGDKAQEAIDALQTAMDDIENIIGNIEEL